MSDPFVISLGAAFLAGLLAGGLIALLVWRSRTAAAPQRQSPGSAEWLRIDVDPATKQPALYLEGRPISQLDSIAEESVRAPVRSLMAVLQAGESAPKTPPVAPITVPGAVANAPLAAPISVLDNRRAPFLERMKDSLIRPGTVTPAQPGPVSAKTAAGTRAEAAPAASMYEQINSILQSKLKAQPGAPDMEIYDDNGELRIRVGSVVYQHIDELNDEPARTLIRAAVAEWEAS